jgi:hypothetical protein
MRKRKGPTSSGWFQKRSPITLAINAQKTLQKRKKLREERKIVKQR